MFQTSVALRWPGAHRVREEHHPPDDVLGHELLGGEVEAQHEAQGQRGDQADLHRDLVHVRLLVGVGLAPRGGEGEAQRKEQRDDYLEEAALAHEHDDASDERLS